MKFYIDGNKIARAQLVALGNADSNNYSDEATYTLVCNPDIICLVFSIAQTYNMSITAMDVTTAFLYVLLD